MNNPFILSFGREPINFIPRINFVQEVEENFYSETRPKQVFMITGVRGTGKTVFLSRLAKKFEKNKDWVVVDLNPERDMLNSLAAQIYNNSKVKHLFLKAKFNFSFNGIGLSIENNQPSNDIEIIIFKMVEYLSSKNIKLLITIDDATSNNNLKVFAHTFQALLRKDYEVFMLMTGLYENLSALQKNKSLTFLSRSSQIILNPLDLPSIKDSYQEIFNINEDEAVKMAKLTNGYAYAYQVLGYLLWNSDTKTISKKILSEYDYYLKSFVYDKIWEGLSNKEIEILQSICESNDINEIIEKIGMDKKTFSVYRDRLIKYGVLISKQRGKVTFALPRFKEYIRNVFLFD